MPEAEAEATPAAAVHRLAEARHEAGLDEIRIGARLGGEGTRRVAACVVSTITTVSAHPSALRTAAISAGPPCSVVGSITMRSGTVVRIDVNASAADAATVTVKPHCDSHTRSAVGGTPQRNGTTARSGA